VQRGLELPAMALAAVHQAFAIESHQHLAEEAPRDLVAGHQLGLGDRLAELALAAVGEHAAVQVLGGGGALRHPECGARGGPGGTKTPAFSL
jgi:hypothetical protein